MTTEQVKTAFLEANLRLLDTIEVNQIGEKNEYFVHFTTLDDETIITAPDNFKLTAIAGNAKSFHVKVLKKRGAKIKHKEPRDQAKNLRVSKSEKSFLTAFTEAYNIKHDTNLSETDMFFTGLYELRKAENITIKGHEPTLF